MCGIVAAISQQNVIPVLLNGLMNLEYRGYDSAGIGIITEQNELLCYRALGKVKNLCEKLAQQSLHSHLGIAHTRWATHGIPSEENAHPHCSHDTIAVVHNGIIENHAELRQQLAAEGYQFTSETDTEIVAHLLHYYQQQAPEAPLSAIALKIVNQLKGAFALAILSKTHTEQIVAVRKGSPLVIGLGTHGQYLGSDPIALISVADKFIYLEEGDVAELFVDKVVIYDSQGHQVERKIHQPRIEHHATDKGHYRHYMQKEIFEQPAAIRSLLAQRIDKEKILADIFGKEAEQVFRQVRQIHIVACGTSYHAGMVAKYWLEDLARIPCHVEIASEFRYRNPVVLPGTLFVALSQSGETVDTLAALRMAKEIGYVSTLAICNVPESAIVRESTLVFLTRAGVEIGVASTKAFTTQLVALLLLTLVLGQTRELPQSLEYHIVNLLRQLPQQVEFVLRLDKEIQLLAETLIDKRHALFLGRGAHYPVALEGALKLKEISYIHAEAYPAGELKHGPLALVDEHMPVIAVAPNDRLLDKLKSNLEVVRARGGRLIVFADQQAQLDIHENIVVIPMPKINHIITPILYTIPLQLLAYYVAVLKGTDVDQPRNLAKSVTVE